MSTHIIGILGGMGPRATVEFEQRLVAQFSGNDQAIPPIVTINDGSIPDRTAFLVEGRDDPVPKLVENALKLLDLGATVLCMPCNTAHASRILARVQGQVPLPIIDMPSASLLEVIERGHQKVLILGTDGTRASGVFESRAHSIGCIYPTTAGQKLVMETIGQIKRGQIIASQQLEAFTNLITQSEAGYAILACTELSLLKDRLPADKIVDSLDALAQRCHAWVTIKGAITKGTSHDTRPIHQPRNLSQRERRSHSVRARLGQ